MIRLRPATPDDLALLTRWDDEPHVLESDPNDDWGWQTELARTPDWREQLIAEADGVPIGFVQTIDPAVTAVLIDPLASNVRAHRFYERLGFRFVERRQFGLDDCFVYRLERAASPA